MKFRPLLTVGALFGALVAGSGAHALPAMPQPGLSQDGLVENAARTTKHERMMRRKNVRRHGDPNARNPERAGHQQQLGGTTNGPRY